MHIKAGNTAGLCDNHYFTHRLKSPLPDGWEVVIYLIISFRHGFWSVIFSAWVRKNSFALIFCCTLQLDLSEVCQNFKYLAYCCCRWSQHTAKLWRLQLKQHDVTIMINSVLDYTAGFLYIFFILVVIVGKHAR